MLDDVLFEQRVIIKFYVKLGKSVSEIKTDLEKVYRDSALKKSGICKWIRRFREGRDTVNDDPKSGRPSTSVTDKIIADVQQHVKQDRRVTVREIAETFSISYGNAQEILTDKLRTFVRFVLVWFCLFSLPLGVWEGLRFVIVALPGLFSYLFWGNVACLRKMGTSVTDARADGGSG